MYHCKRSIYMILIITIIVSFLVAINFLLLIFSCNTLPEKSVKKSRPVIHIKTTPSDAATSQLQAPSVSARVS